MLPGPCKALLSSLKAQAVSLVLLGPALTVGSQSSMGASKRGEDAQRKAVFLLRMGFGHGGERGEQLHEGVQVGAAKEVTSPWVEMWHQPSFTLTAIKQSTGAQNPQRHLISTLVLSPFYCPLI